MVNMTVSVDNKNWRRAIRKETRDDVVDSPNDEIYLYGLCLEEIMSKA